MRLLAFGDGGGGRAVAGVVTGVAAAALLSTPAWAERDEPAELVADGVNGTDETDGANESGEGDEATDAALVGVVLSGAERPPRPGEEFLYRVTVVNDREGAVENGRLAQHLPEPLEVVEVGQDGLMEEGVANWRVDVPEGDESAYTVRVRVPEDVPAQARVVSTACLLMEERDAEPSACASDTLLVAEPTMLSRVGEVFDGKGVIRAVGVGALMLLVWLLWRQWGVLRRR